MIVARGSRSFLTNWSLVLLLVTLFCFNDRSSHWLFSGIHVAKAWDSDGHQAIGMTAMSALSGKASIQVKRLLGGKDVVDVAGWAHRVEAKYPKTASFHIQHQPNKWECDQATTTEANCPENRCLIRALQHFYGRLTGRPDLIKLDYPDNLKLTDSDAVKFLINLLGDLHQPLRVGFAEDFGGQNITLVYTDSKREKRQTTMFSYWDSALLQKFIQERPAFWYGGWTHAHSLGERLSKIHHEWETHNVETRHLLFEKWATESLHLACNNVYKDPRSGTIILSGFESGSTYEYTAIELIKTQILTAGARTGLVLNSILAERDAAKLRQGSGVEIALENEFPFNDKSRSSSRYFRSFCINVVIIIVVLGGFAYVTRFYSPSGAPPTSSTSTRNVLSSKQMEKRS